MRNKQLKILTGCLMAIFIGSVRAESLGNNLSNEIDLLKSRLTELESAENRNWLNERRSKEIKSLIHDVLSDADTRANLLAEGATAGHNGKAFYLSSDDGSFLLKVNGQIQLRYIYRSQDDSVDATGSIIPPGTGADGQGFRVTPTIGDENDAGLVIRRAKVKFSGHIVDPRLNYVAQLTTNRASNNVSSDKIMISYKLTDGITVWAGENKAPFLREEMISSSKQLAVERSYVNEVFTLDTTQGIGLIWETDENLKVQVMLHDGSNSGNGGSGTNRFTQAFGAQGVAGAGGALAVGACVAGDCTQATTLDFDADRTDFAITARTDVKLAGQWSQMADFTASEGEEDALFLGAAIHYEVGETGDTGHNHDFVTWTVDGSYEGNGLNVYTAVTGMHSNFDDEDDTFAEDYNLYGLIVQAGHVIPNSGWEPFVRWEYLDLDDAINDGSNTYDNLNLLTIGANRYFSKHAAKFTLDIVFALDAVPINSGGLGIRADNPNIDGQTVVRAQYQLTF